MYLMQFYGYDKSIATSTFCFGPFGSCACAGKETEMQEKEMKLMELQEMYESRLLAMKVTFLTWPFCS